MRPFVKILKTLDKRGEINSTQEKVHTKEESNDRGRMSGLNE